MSDAAFRTVITVIAVVATASMIVQAFFAFGMYRAVQQLRDRLEPLMGRAEPIIDHANRILAEARPRIEEVTRKAVEVAETARVQVAKYDELLNEAAGRAREHMDRLDYLLADTTERVQETAAAVHNSILRPVREVNGVMNGVRAALTTLARGRRPTVEQVTQDEEMFI
ncbi:MAG: hypothetical protein ACKV22_27680 [Bryobacteraceae bacterium]